MLRLNWYLPKVPRQAGRIINRVRRNDIALAEEDIAWPGELAERDGGRIVIIVIHHGGH